MAVGLAAAQAGNALHGTPSASAGCGATRHGDRERALQLVPPLDRDRLPALGLDRRARNRPLEAPDARGGEVAVEAVLARPDAHGQPAVVLCREQP